MSVMNLSVGKMSLHQWMAAVGLSRSIDGTSNPGHNFYYDINENKWELIGGKLAHYQHKVSKVPGSNPRP